VNIDSVDVVVDKSDDDSKGCSLNMDILTADNPKKVFTIYEGLTNNITSFVIQPKQESTDPNALLEINRSYGVKSSDYAVVRFRGMLSGKSEDSWKDGDLKIKVIFSFFKDQGN
jgi:hypothetical protein